MFRYAKIDDNQKQIVRGLRAVGCSVLSLASLGNGAPDLLAGRNGKNWLLEVKDGDKCPSAQKLTDDESVWHEKWRGQVNVVRNLDEAIKLICS